MSDDKIQNNKLHVLGKLTASLIHEIRNPLAAIKLNLDYLRMIEKELPSEVNDTVDSSVDALARIQYLIDNVLNFSRKNYNGPKLCSINDVTSNAIEIMSGNARRMNVKVERYLDENIPMAYFDKSKLLQVFLNLITNALESCSNEGKVIIRTYIDGMKFVIWEIEDNGIGICEEDKEKIFNDFFTSKENGTGLGLSVCKMILHDYQAELNFESTLGKGTKFSIIFNPNIMQDQNEI